MTDERSPQRMGPGAAVSLWTDPDSARQFLIPEGLELPPGGLRLRGTAGQECQVAPAAVAPFEVNAEEATAWLEDQLRQVAGRLGVNLREALRGLAPTRRETRDSDTAASSTPGLDLLADITGTPRAGLDGDYAAIGQALRDYFGDLAATTLDTLGGDPQHTAAARARMAEWAQTLRMHGIAAPDVTEGATTSAVDGTAPIGRANEAAAACQGTATTEQAAATGLADSLRRLAESFQRRADELATARRAAGVTGTRSDESDHR